ncbi:MAG TPA: ABC transporter ATP-binding protein [Steroidobacteraceae bacterium]|nr:ABC transporter ATP-binding protein [Steroidobacteraceae bacterium]
MNDRALRIPPAAALIGAVKRFGATTALTGIDLRIEPGRITALLGPNGAGKSTSIALLLGLLEPDSGRAELFGESPLRIEVRQRLGLMLQSAALPETLRVRELLSMTSKYYPQPLALAECAATAAVTDLLPRFYGRLSGGQQRRVQFAVAICGRPELLVLDEPTVGLDITARTAVWQSVRSLAAAGCAVLLSTHHLEEAEALADHVAVIMQGRVVASGTVSEVRAHGIHRRIRCVTSVSAEDVRKWEDVRAVERRQQRLDIETVNAEAIVRRLLIADPHLAELEVLQAGLAEALAAITQEAA